MDLFKEIKTGAHFSQDNQYRYALWRIWDPEKPCVLFIGLNPSTATENKDDPTIRRVKKFAFNWGYGGFYMVNLFALVTPYPEVLMQSDDPLGENDSWIDHYASKCNKIIFAWGSFDIAHARAKEIMTRHKGYSLVINKDGSPRHPLYVNANTEPVEFHHAQD